MAKGQRERGEAGRRHGRQTPVGDRTGDVGRQDPYLRDGQRRVQGRARRGFEEDGINAAIRARGVSQAGGRRWSRLRQS